MASDYVTLAGLDDFYFDLDEEETQEETHQSQTTVRGNGV